MTQPAFKVTSTAGASSAMEILSILDIEAIGHCHGMQIRRADVSPGSIVESAVSNDSGDNVSHHAHRGAEEEALLSAHTSKAIPTRVEPHAIGFDKEQRVER
jgi:hypothetical protein